LGLIAQKLETMISAGDPDQIYSKHKAITALFPYAVWQEQDGQHKVLDVCLHAARASKWMDFLWYHIRELPIARLLNGESPVSAKQAFILMSPHLPWYWRMNRHEHWVQLWAAAASAVPYTDEIGQCVADTLLHIAHSTSLQPHIPIDMWSWLRKPSSLPPICTGRYRGRFPDVIEIVQGLGDIETLTAYLLLVWSEWELHTDQAIQEMCALIRNDFSGIRMGYHQKKLLQHLDHVLRQLELGPEYLQQYNPVLDEGDIQWRQGQYRQLREALLEVDREAINLLVCEFSRLFILFCLLNFCMQLKDHTQCLCVQYLFYLCSWMSGVFPTASPALQVFLKSYSEFHIYLITPPVVYCLKSPYCYDLAEPEKLLWPCNSNGVLTIYSFQQVMVY
jgi:hypothetical protein